MFPVDQTATRRRIALLSALLALAAAPPCQTLAERVVKPSMQLPSLGEMHNYALTIGDLNGDGVPDLVFSNQLAYLAVYYMQRQGGSLTVASRQEVLPSAGGSNCAQRHKSAAHSGFDRALIYDIDIDGLNELIYFDYLPPTRQFPTGTVGLRVYEFENGALKPQSHDPVDLSALHRLTGSGGYFKSGCTENLNHAAGWKLAIANVRGRAYPQDIVVWNSQPKSSNFSLFAYDSNGAGKPTLTPLLHDYRTIADYVPLPFRGEIAANWTAHDVNWNGREELIGNLVFGFDDQGANLLWGMVFKNDTTATHETNVHADDVLAVDLFDTYLDEALRVIPAPGIEVVVAPQLQGDPDGNVVPESGPWIYRAVTGHEMHAGKRAWPRKVLNYEDKYWFYSHLVSGGGQVCPTWRQPTPKSLWKEVQTSFLQWASCSGPKAVNVQTVTVAPFIPGGPLELLATSKANGVPGMCSGCKSSLGHVFYLFDAGHALPALDWDHSTCEANGPTIWGHMPIDNRVDRSAVNACGPIGVTCDWANGSGHAVFRWVRDDTPSRAPRSYKPCAVYLRTNSGSEILGGGVPADVIGDSREEYVFFRRWPDELVIVEATDTAPQRTNQPPPWRFLGYRRGTGNPKERPADFGAFGGLRFRTRALLKGQVGELYGVLQDARLDPAANGPVVGCAIVPEGGKPPYTITQADTTPLHKGLQWPIPVVYPANTSDHNSTGGAVALIQGTPTEHGIKRFRLRVADDAGASHEQDFWLRVEPGFAPVDPPTTPRIVAAGFGGAYLVGGQAQDVLFEAKVADEDQDTQGVLVYLRNGPGEPDTYLLTLYDDGQGGDMITGDGVFSRLVANLALPKGDFFFRMLAADARGNVSRPWPHMAVDGGPGDEDPDFAPDLQQGSRAAATTPRIRWVEFEPGTVNAAEETDDPGSLTLRVHLFPLADGTELDTVVAKIGHPLTAGTHFPQITFTEIADLVYQGVFTPPPGQFGYGYYSVNVQVVARDQDDSSTKYHSDWWPRLRAH